MAHASLAALYRPQTFSQVVGQDMVKTVLSRAALESKVAPAYLLSGTRGVGKTTIARIFAKALNCEKAPVGEPCNECDACRRITQGSFVDVVEIDGASNRGIDDVRRLRDAVGYAPLEGRYKVFIIDEAHMLTKEAFNALLKTLEEPPARVTFILATTEQHKFPITIVSRCQHFVFRQIPEAHLEEHICGVLNQEGRAFEAEAAQLIARRAAGSVRDSMSLLGQVLAFCAEDGTTLTAATTRSVLGLAGQEVLDRLLAALARQDVTAIVALVRELLAQGVDMGFFLRELGSLWRNLFLIRQAGAEASNLGFSSAELEQLQAFASRFSLAYIHSAWQMTLDGQRRILTSLEPAAGLELLLLNLAMLPRLLPLEELDISRCTPKHMSDAPPGVPCASLEEASPTSAIKAAAEKKTPAESSPVRGSADGDFAPKPMVEEPAAQPSPPSGIASPGSAFFAQDDQTEVQDKVDVVPGSGAIPREPAHHGPLTWEEFLAFCATRNDLPVPSLRQFTGVIQDDKVTLQTPSQTLVNQVQRKSVLESLKDALREWAGRPLQPVILPASRVLRSESDIRSELEEHPTVQALQKNYDATILRCTMLDEKDANI